MAKTYKNDIFEVIKQIDNKNYQYYESLSDEQKKEIQPYTLLRWMSSSAGDDKKHQKYNMMVNENVNKHFWELSKYKDLQFKLLCTCGQGFSRHQWIPMSKSKVDKIYNILRQFNNHLTDQEFALKYPSMNKDEIKGIQQFLGLMDK